MGTAQYCHLNKQLQTSGTYVAKYTPEKIYDTFGISFGAFKQIPSLKKVIIPEGITIIQEAVFDGCTKLEEIVLPKSLVKMTSDQNSLFFYDCSSLKKIIFF